MDKLFEKQDRLLQLTTTKIVRHLMEEINWDAQLIAIRGARGVGKTTLLLQYIKLHYPTFSSEVLYCSLDSIYFSTHSILELTDSFYKNGGKHLFLDEVHKYPGWSKEIKEIYDSYPDLKVTFTASSLLHILGGDADLSRRCVPYTMQGLSFREFLEFHKGIKLNSVPLVDMLNNPAMLCEEVNKSCHPLQYFKEYLQIGYYPYYLKNKIDYYTCVENVAYFVVENEMPQICGVDISNVRKIKALLGIMANSVPYEVDITKLATMIQIHRNTVISYLYEMDRAELINMVFSDLNSIKKLQKPDKIFMENTNLTFALSDNQANIGTIRETFVVNQLSYQHRVEYSKKAGDFRIDNKYTFEVGGESKEAKQIVGVTTSYILADDLEYPIGNKLPLWIVGFCY